MTAISISKDFIAPFVEAVTNTFSMMIGTTVTKEGAYLRDDHNVQYDISGVMGITGDKVNGTIAISFPEDFACKVVSNFLGEEQGEVNSTVIDGVGELINIVSGEAKRLFEGKELLFDISLPAVIQGHGHKIGNKSSVPHVLIAFKAEDGSPFAIQVAVEIAED